MTITDPKLEDATAAAMVDDEVLSSLLHEIDLHSDVLFTWDYTRSRPALVKLYEKAKTSQWNASTDLDWSI
ncbi:MAG: ferritin-like domain-containing protein, partial [Microthrixaceae bacterium]